MKKKPNDKERDYECLVEEESLILEATEMIEELLELADVNRKELAERLGRSKGFITQVLAGDRNMTLRTLADLAFALDHRVKVAAGPLTEAADGGEALANHAPAMARVYAGAGEYLAQSRQRRASEDPRRQKAAEGAGQHVAHVLGSYCNARSGEDRPDLHLLGTYGPLERNRDQEPVAS